MRDCLLVWRADNNFLKPSIPMFLLIYKPTSGNKWQGLLHAMESASSVMNKGQI